MTFCLLPSLQVKLGYVPLGLFVATGLRDFCHSTWWVGMERLTLVSAKVCLLPPVGTIAETFWDVSVGKAGGEINEQPWHLDS